MTSWGASPARWIATAALLGFVGLAAGGCAMVATNTSRSTIEQRLLARSLERAVAGLDVRELRGRRVVLDLLGLTPDAAFAKAFLAARLEGRGVHVVDDKSAADLTLHVFATGLGVDQGSTLIGIPQVTVPVVGVTVPEIALFKWERHRGLSELQVYAFDHGDGHFIEEVPTAAGHSKYDQFTLLLIIRFSHDDLRQYRDLGKAPTRAGEGQPRSEPSPPAGEKPPSVD